MFCDFYQLREQPFGVTPDPRFLYLTESHREALASLFYGIQEERGFVSLIAPPGMGKTTLLFHLLERLRGSASTAFVFQTQCDSRELIRYILADLEIDSHDDDLVTLHEKLNRELIRMKEVGTRFVLVLDEAQNFGESLLETIRLLSDLETPRSKLMQIVLAGQPGLAKRLLSPRLTQLRQRISIYSQLRPLSAVEVDRYIEHRLAVAGYFGRGLFTREALTLIASHSGGVPRNINALCFAALSAGFAMGRPVIDAKILKEAIADLDLHRQTEDMQMPASSDEPEPTCQETPWALSPPAKTRRVGPKALRLSAVALWITLVAVLAPSVVTQRNEILPGWLLHPSFDGVVAAASSLFSLEQNPETGFGADHSVPNSSAKTVRKRSKGTGESYRTSGGPHPAAAVLEQSPRPVNTVPLPSELEVSVIGDSRNARPQGNASLPRAEHQMVGAPPVDKAAGSPREMTPWVSVQQGSKELGWSSAKKSQPATQSGLRTTTRVGTPQGPSPLGAQASPNPVNQPSSPQGASGMQRTQK